MDKSWIKKPHTTPEYRRGVNSFLDFAFQQPGLDTIICPCSKCGFKWRHNRKEVEDHLLCKPFPQGYTIWYLHGEEESESSAEPTIVRTHVIKETIPNEDPMRTMINDAFGFPSDHASEEPSMTNGSRVEDETAIPDSNPILQGEAKEFYELLKDGEQALYEGCMKYSKLSFLIKLYHIKCLCGISDKALAMILELLHDAFDQANIPPSGYEAKKIITKLGLRYTKIHACPNDCMLYLGEDENREECKVCQASRWNNNSTNGSDSGKKRKQKAAKILRYFPLIPRLKRLFMSSKTAENMMWHATENNNDGMMRHPRDSDAWKFFDLTHPDFASDSRNVRLGLATDGFNPFGSMSNSYSIWPIVLIPYNTPPWMCMKPMNFILSSIIPGKHTPGNDIDIYLQPLILELKELWEKGVETYDASKNEVFMMRACLLWTISDFPGLGILSGWNTYTGIACPSCNFDSVPRRLPYSRKWCFMGHRRFLPNGHRFRLSRLRFDGNVEDRDPPKKLSGSEILKQLEDIDITLGKQPQKSDKGKRKRSRRKNNVVGNQVKQWKKRSIFFELPYWEFNLLRHNLDVMHIEKNVCDNIIFTLLNDKDKGKDHLEARKDLQAMGIKRDLWPLEENGKTCPAALFTLTKEEINVMLSTLKDVTVPDGYSSNISRCIDNQRHKIYGLKSHDCHILMEQLLPLAIRNVLPIEVSSILVDVCSFFKSLCGKVLNPQELTNLNERIALAMCHLEMVFPPSFFTVMVHLMIHLVDEAKLGGPVQYRWMYPIER